MKLLALLIAVSLTGCLWANDKSDTMWGVSGRAMIGEHGDLQGGTLDAQWGGAGLYAAVEANTHEVTRPEDLGSTRAIGVNVSLKASLPGMFAPKHELERYFDLGPEGGVGGLFSIDAPRSPNPFNAGAAYFGWWFEIGTVSIGDHYIAIVGDVRREAYGAPWDDQTQLIVGLAWRHRELLGPLNFHD